MKNPNHKIYIDYFFHKIVGFKTQETKTMKIGQSDDEYLSIAMDRIDRLTKPRGQLRKRVWSNVYFIFNSNDVNPSVVYRDKISSIKKNYPFLFIRSYFYLVFINTYKDHQSLMSFDDLGTTLSTSDFKIWFFNSNYEIKEESRRSNIFGVSENRSIDDIMYLANPESELQRMSSSNSDAIDCVKAFTGDLELLEQTSSMLETIRDDLTHNPHAKILVEGPARSGKTIIAATILGEYKDSKFLLMNYYFYQAIIDGFHALSGWSNEEIKSLIGNDELDVLVELKDKFPKTLMAIDKNLAFLINENTSIKKLKKTNGSKTRKWLLDNIVDFLDSYKKLGYDEADFPLIKGLNSLKENINKENSEVAELQNFELIKLKIDINKNLDGTLSSLIALQNRIVSSIEDLIENSRQKFFHHNINKNISSKVTSGCWIERGNPTTSKMWTKNYKPNLIICDEVQRLGLIPKYSDDTRVIYDEFNEIDQLLNNSNQSFFVGDDFQMLNSKYDQGITKVIEEASNINQTVSRHRLPDSVGVPPEIGILMKFLTDPNTELMKHVVDNWNSEKDYEIIFIDNNFDELIRIFDEDVSNKKHLSVPLDYSWFSYYYPNSKVRRVFKLSTKHRKKPIIALKDHEEENFAYRFPYFCNEEVMPNYFLSAYELISREVESFYVHIPIFPMEKHIYNNWFRKHLYVLFTRPTLKLIVNCESHRYIEHFKELIKKLNYSGGKLDVKFY